ncbi:MAG TPA: hypothetical protein VFQ90_15605 [Stellaceae bacterium]|jgi:hypothetical protein|nr:hypothetical protein [Stellaceae bacterium]
MQRGAFAGAPRRGAWRSQNIVAAVVIAAIGFGLAAAASAETSGMPLIRIPPARLSPLAAAPPAVAATPSKIPPAARALLPTDVQVLHDSRGAGMAMYGALTGKAGSAVGVILAVFAHSQAFDPSPALQLVLADEANRHAQALFTATVHGAPVIGVAVAALSDDGGDITVFYDAADAFAASFPRMREALAASNGVGMAVLTPLRLADGGTIDVPPGWQLTAQGAGDVKLSGPQGELMSLGATLPVYAGPGAEAHQLRGQCCDPVDAFAAIYPQLAAAAGRSGAVPQEPGDILDSAPTTSTTGDKGAFIFSNLRVSGDAYLYLAQAEAVAGFTNPWTFKLSGVMAPQALFAAELPTLVQVWKSYSGAGSGFADKVERALQSMSLTKDVLGATTTTRQTAEYNAAALWSEAIAGLAKTRDGEIDGELAASLAKRLSADTNRPWRVVTETEWK